MKEKLENLKEKFESVKNEIDLTKNDRIQVAQARNTDQMAQNKIIEDKIALKKKTINLINDAPMNILKLKVFFSLFFFSQVNYCTGRN